jgi:hypothetical protein
MKHGCNPRWGAYADCRIEGAVFAHEIHRTDTVPGAFVTKCCIAAMSSRFDQNLKMSTKIARFLGAVVGFVFAGIGITVLVFLWGTPWNEFGSPPLGFRVFGSFIAIAFVAVGGGMGLGAILVRRPALDGPTATAKRGRRADAPQDMPPAKYDCPRCGAPLENGHDVSPHGDAKCGYCNSWFSVRGP